MRPPRILIVEDEILIAKSISQSLEKAGYQVAAIVGTGLEAVRLTQEESPDLVLMDIVLDGDMDGFQVADQLRSGLNPPVVYLTAYEDREIVDRAMQTRPYGYVVKPFSHDELMRTIDIALFRSNADRRIREQQKFLSDVIESLAHPFYVVDANDYTVLIANSAASKEHQAQGASCYGLFHGYSEPCSGAEFPCPLEDVKRSGKPTRVNHVHCEKNGTVRYSEIHAYPIFDRVGKVTQIIVYAVDVTDRELAKKGLCEAYGDLEKRVEERTAELSAVNKELLSEIKGRLRVEEHLRNSEQRFRAIFETAPDSVFMKDLSLKYTLVNPRMELLLGLPASKIIGRTDRDLFGGEVGHYLHVLDSRVLKGESVETECTRIVNGSSVAFLETRTPVYDDNGFIIGICGISRDITDRKTAYVNTATAEVEYSSLAMQSALTDARLAAATDCTVLLTGESGAGKDFVAQYIHRHSKRSGGPFHVVNCAGVPHDLAESELFGHEAGAFTGAQRLKRGWFELAEGGTLLLNECTEFPLSLQAKLLTFLDTKSFTRVGGEKTIEVDVRLIAATNGDLEKAVQKGEFRTDLFFRLNVMSIRVPSLRERTEDIPILVEDLVSKVSTEMGLLPTPKLGSSILQILSRYSWPGNVRELRNAMERVLIVSRGDPEKMNDPRVWNLDHPRNSSFTKDGVGRSYNDMVRELKSSLIEDALRRAGGSKTAAARLLGMSRDALNRQMKTLHLV